MTGTTMLRGGCYCGRVAYQVPDAFEAAFYCHCSRCRRATGSAFKAMAAIKYEHIGITAGEADIMLYGDPGDTHDTHCRHCGSLLFSYIAENGNGHVTLGTLIDTPTIRPSFHIFVGSKAPWYEINDDLAQFDALPG